MKNTAGSRLKTGAVGLAGLVVGGVLAATLSANADEAPGSATDGYAGGHGDMGDRDHSPPQRDDEELLTGDEAAKVQEAVLAKYPGATVVRIETDSDGVYEAHLTKADGTPVTVEVGKDFGVTGEEELGSGGHGGFGGHGHHHDGDEDSRDGAGADRGDTA